MSSATPTQTPAPSVHSQLRANTSALVALEVERAELVVAWVAEHRVDGEPLRGRGREGDLTGRGLELAGQGAPVVDDLEFCSLAASLSQSVDAARAGVSEIVELAFRLPVLWQRVRDGQVRLWRAQRVARSTSELSWDAATWVDRQVAPLVTSCSAAQVERTVTAAMENFDPERAEERRRAAQDRRRFDIHLHEAGHPVVEPGAGTVHVDGLLDTADALDLEAAVRAGAAAVERIAPEAPESVRRSIAVGELARGQHPLPAVEEVSAAQDADEREEMEEKTGPHEGTVEQRAGAAAREKKSAGQPAPEKGSCDHPEQEHEDTPTHPVPTHRTVTLYLHLDAAAMGAADGTVETAAGGVAARAVAARELAQRSPNGAPEPPITSDPETGCLDTRDQETQGARTQRPALGIGRCENTRSPVTAEQVRRWCQTAGTVLVRPVIDLADNPRTDAYSPTPRMREQVILRDGHCVFPYCGRPARRADVDHIVPYESDGPTEPDNLAALCRRHHRAKTFRAWDYAQVTPGTFLWHGPQGRTYLVTGAGTFPAPPGPSAAVGPPP